MIRVTAIYPNAPGKRFDFDYYVNSHQKMVRELPAPYGLQRVDSECVVGDGISDSPSPYIAIGRVEFDTMEHFQEAFSKHAEQFVADVPNYTDIEPQVLISESLD